MMSSGAASFLFELPLAMRVGPVDFAEPWWLLAFLLIVPIVWLWRTSKVPASGLRRWVSLGLRVVLVGAIVLSLAGTRVVWFNHGICVVFAIDQSQSVPGAVRETVRARIEQEVQKMQKDDLFVVVEFGGDAVLGSLPSPRGPMPVPTKVLDTGHTDIARALRLAMASFPSDRQKRIVLFSDGNQNIGDALREARIAAVNDADVDVLLLAAKAGHEVMVEQLVTPPHVQKDANFVVRAIISTDIDQDGQLLISRDGRPMPGRQIRMKAGTNVYDIPDALADGGFHEYQVTVVPAVPENDTFPANNTGYAFTQVDAPGRVLLVRGKMSEEDYLSTALKGPPARLALDTVTVGGLPATVQGLAAYDCVILDNVNRFDIEPQMQGLHDWVINHGGGLVLVGGDNSFGPGGWKDTPIEQVSPVDMDVKRVRHLASLAIVVVLDKSGSMGMPATGGVGLEKMDLANAGAVEVLKLLDESDEAMVGVVDTEVKWMLEGRVVPMNFANKARIKSNTLAVRAGGGGIYCKTALAHAYELLTKPGVSAMSKHVIMFADAQDSEQQEDCVAMAKAMFEKQHITTSVIGMGTPRDPHVPFQKEVAKVGHGRWDVTDDVMNLPKLFAKEAFIVSRNAFVEKKEGIVPQMHSSPLLEGFWDKATGKGGVPRVYGYVGTTLKPRATLAMHGLEVDDPLLAHWSIGLGKCVAYTSDDTNHWGKDWASWEGYAKFWSQVVRWVSKSMENSSVVTTTVIEGNNGRVIADAVDEAGKPLNNLQLKANVSPPDSTRTAEEVGLEQVGPGRYEGKFLAGDKGMYLVTVMNGKTGDPVSRGGGVLSYPPEYRDLTPNAALMRALAEESGGKYLGGLEGVFGRKPEPVRTFWPLWQMLLVVVAGGLVVDVAWRRLNVGDWLRRSTAGSYTAMAGAGSAVGAFGRVKSGRGSVQEQREKLRARIEVRAAAGAAETGTGAVSTTVVEAARASGPVAGGAGSGEAVKPTVPGEGYANRLMSAKRRAAAQIKEQKDVGRNDQ